MVTVLALPVLCIRGGGAKVSFQFSKENKKCKCFDSVLIAITPIFLNLVKHS